MTDTPTTPAEAIIRASAELSRKILALSDFMRSPPKPAAYALDPTIYAAPGYEAFVRVAASSPRRVLILGMNPSPHGMGQCGVPFGDVSYARRVVKVPPLAHPASRGNPPIFTARGFEYPRGEESGSRLWAVLEQMHGSLAAALRACCVLNYCPILFLSEDGRNIALGDLSRRNDQVRALYDACDEHLRVCVSALRCEVVIGLGGVAADAAGKALGNMCRVIELLHPSPHNGNSGQWTSRVWPTLQAETLPGAT